MEALAAAAAAAAAGVQLRWAVMRVRGEVDRESRARGVLSVLIAAERATHPALSFSLIGGIICFFLLILPPISISDFLGVRWMACVSRRILAAAELRRSLSCRSVEVRQRQRQRQRQRDRERDRERERDEMK